MKRGILFILAIILLSYIVISEESQNGVIMSAGDNVTVGGRGIKYMYGDTTQAIFKIDGYLARAALNQNKSFHGIRLFVREAYGNFVILDITAYHICGDNVCASDEFCCRDCGCNNITGVSCVNNMCMQNNTFFDIQENINQTNITTPPINSQVINQTNITTPQNITSPQNITNATGESKFKLRVNFDFLKDNNTRYVMMIIFAVIVLVFIKFELTNKKKSQEVIEQRTITKTQPVSPAQNPIESPKTPTEISKEPENSNKK